MNKAALYSRIAKMSFVAAGASLITYVVSRYYLADLLPRYVQILAFLSALVLFFIGAMFLTASQAQREKSNTLNWKAPGLSVSSMSAKERLSILKSLGIGVVIFLPINATFYLLFHKYFDNRQLGALVLVGGSAFIALALVRLSRRISVRRKPPLAER